MYSDKILELFKNPLNAGGLQGANGVGKYTENACGDNIKIYLKIENDVVSEARFKTLGSAGTIVACSAICSCVLDCSLDEAKQIDSARIQEVTGKYPDDKEYCLDYAIKALNMAIDDYYEKIEKAQKKAEKQGKEVIESKVESPKPITQPKIEPKVESAVEQRRTVSAAKAAFDALFE